MTATRDDLDTWLDDMAERLDHDARSSSDVLPKLASAGVFHAGLPAYFGGHGDTTDAVEAIAATAYRSMTAGFVAWGHRTFIEYLVQSPNERLRQAQMPKLLSGERAGATGLSNAMKFLSGLEGLQIEATPSAKGFRLNGKLPWVTNLRPAAFVVAAAVAERETSQTLVVAIPSDAIGVRRSSDLDLMAMRGSNTAAIDLVDVSLERDHVLTADARSWLPQVRPAFLGLQCGLSIGLARRSLDEARRLCGAGRHVLRAPIEDLTTELASTTSRMSEGLRSGIFVSQAAGLFGLRIRLAEIAQEAVSLELHAAGGRAYLTTPGSGFQRRWREAAFVPIITPSLVQLKAALDAQRAEQAA